MNGTSLLKSWRKHYVGFTLVGVGILLAFTFIVSCVILSSAVRIFPLHADTCHIIPVYTLAEDSVMQSSLSIDSLDKREVWVLKERVNKLEQLNERLVDDIRQETNNNINILNGWLTFWMGLLALVGVFLPMVFQYKMKKEDEQKLEELKTKFAEERLRFQCLMQENHLQSLVYSISNGIDYQLLLDGPHANDILNRLYKESLDCFNEIVQIILGESRREERRLSEEEVTMLITSILSMHKLYIILYQNCVKDERSIERCMDTLKTTMNDVNSYKRMDSEALGRSLKRMLDLMYAIDIQ
jgi:hypothetical protein